ncbi:MAG: SxtJ family membrane protein [Candidatus Berkiella sp.]
MMTQQNITSKELRNFGFILSSIFIALFGILLPLLKSQPSPTWPWIFASTLLVFAFFVPKLLKFIYLPWMKLGALLGWINTRIILGVIFFIVITPISFVLRIAKYDPLKRHFEPEAKSYRIQSESQSIKHMERPY